MTPEKIAISLQDRYYQGDTSALQQLYQICMVIIAIKLYQICSAKKLTFDNLNERAHDGVTRLFERYLDQEKRKKRFRETGDSRYFVRSFNQMLHHAAMGQIFPSKKQQRYEKLTVFVDDFTDYEDNHREKILYKNPLEFMNELEQTDKSIIVILNRHKVYSSAIKRIALLKSQLWIINHNRVLYELWKLLHPQKGE